MASWFFLFSRSACAALRRLSARKTRPITTSTMTRRPAKTKTATSVATDFSACSVSCRRPTAFCSCSEPATSCEPACRAVTSFCSSRRIGLTFFSNPSNCFLSSASLARASLSRTGDDRERVAPGLERPDEVAQVVGVLADQERHFRVDGFRPEDLGGTAAQALGEDREAVGAKHLARRGARLAHERGELLRARGHFLGADADLGDVLRERDQVVAGGQDGRGGFRRLGPALGQLVEAALQLVGRGRRRHVHPEGEAALLEDLEIVRELVAAVLHLGECRGLAAGREARGLGQALRVVLHLGGHRHVRRALRARRGVQEHHQRGEGHEQQRDGAQDVHLGRDRHVADQRKREVVEAEERPGRRRLLRRAAAQDRRRPARAGRGSAGRQVRHRRRGGGRGARARLRLGRDEPSEPVRERCLGFCRRCFGHGVLRAA